MIARSFFLALFLPVLAPLDGGEPTSSSPAISPTIDAIDWESVTFFSSVKGALGMAAEGFWRQFTYKSSLATLTGGAGAVWLADANDRSWSASMSGNDFFTSDIVSVLGDETSIALGLTPLISFYLSRWLEDEKMYRFSVETFASLSIAWVETMALSQIDYHIRPRDEGPDPATGFFDTAFRGSSSWPSGHLIKPFTLTFKMLDYYGWKAAIIPAGLTVLAAGNRIADGSHYPSDIVGAGVLSLAAHIATKKISDRKRNLHVSVAPLRNGLWVSASCAF